MNRYLEIAIITITVLGFCIVSFFIGKNTERDRVNQAFFTQLSLPKTFIYEYNPKTNKFRLSVNTHFENKYPKLSEIYEFDSFQDMIEYASDRYLGKHDNNNLWFVLE